MDYDLKIGWHKPQISPYHKLQIDPTNSALHYAIQLFEGMKAYRSSTNLQEVLLFRPEMNMKRMNISAKRIGLPPFDGEELIKCIERFVAIERDWLPYERGYALYIRPTYISMTNQLGVLPPREAKIFIILSPVGPYFTTGFTAIKIICSEGNNRSWPGGFGYAKLGANYGPTLEYLIKIKAMGYHQVLWLIDDKITEVGVMNFFVYWINEQGEKELITCPCDGTILPGVIRDSVITLCKEWGIKVSEKYYTIHQLIEANNTGRLLEAFGTGTAAIICPIREISYKNESHLLIKDPTQSIGELGKRLYDRLLDIQTGVVKHPWSRSIIC